MELNDLSKLYPQKREAVMPTRRDETILEPIITLKAYDQCRQQYCLDNELLPSREVEEILENGDIVPGPVITPPIDASEVQVKNFQIAKVIILDKTPNPFKQGFWDVTIRYIFTYELIFTDMDDSVLETYFAMTTATKKCTLFGSNETDTLVTSDLFTALNPGSNSMITNDPYLIIEAKAVALSACLIFNEAGEPVEVELTVGLFAIIEIVRLVNLLVESQGFSIPTKCNDEMDFEPCDFFKRLDFPMDIFSPPQINEFMAGATLNIPSDYEHVDEICDCCTPICCADDHRKPTTKRVCRS